MIRKKTVELARKPASAKQLKIGTAPTIEFERGAGFPHFRVLGVDEVGRGCLAGPVVAAAVLLPAAWDLPLKALRKKFPEIAEITDSKKLTETTRDSLAPWIRENVLAFAIGEASVGEIDAINIYHASHLAMHRAAEAVGNYHHILVDGNAIPIQFREKASAIIKGDLRCLSIACASIIAKVYRDQFMRALGLLHPEFGFEVHKGYGTSRHSAALKSHGVTDHHRRSFTPVRLALGLISAPEQNLELFSEFDSSDAKSAEPGVDRQPGPGFE